jgi:hypothetical protein
MNRIVLLLVLVMTGSIAKAQKLHLSVGVEKTAPRCLYGAGLTFEFKGKWGIGTFYQQSIPNTPKENPSSKDAFYGVLFQVPLAKTERIDFFATARFGMVNENFFVFVPGLETRIKTWNKLSTVFGMGDRVGYPAISLKLSHPIF